MKSSAAMIIVPAMLVVSLATTMFIAGDACDENLTMSRSDACYNACHEAPWYNVCPETLKKAPDTAEVTVYALVAARLTKLRYETTTAAAERLLGDPSLPADMRAAYKYCIDQYNFAGKRMDGVISDLQGCELKNIKREYDDSETALWNCENALSALSDSLPLLKMVEADRNVAAVADDLGSLVVGI